MHHAPTYLEDNTYFFISGVTNITIRDASDCGGGSVSPVVPPHVRRRLKEKNVDLFDPRSFTLLCRKCGRTWQPTFGENGRLSRGYWRCPNGCNE